MKALLLLSVLISLASPALARIGETREQCEARYGKPVDIEKEKEMYDYKKADFGVSCTFRDGVCVQIVFWHEIPGEVLYAPLLDAEITTLLNANGGGKQWTKDDTSSEPDHRVWTCGDLRAKYTGLGLNTLHINTKAFRDEKEAEKNGKPKDPLKDF